MASTPRHPDAGAAREAETSAAAPFDPFNTLSWRFRPTAAEAPRKTNLAPLALAIVVAMHAGLLLLFDEWSEPRRSPAADTQAIEVFLLDAAPPPMVAPPPLERPIAVAKPTAQARQTPPRTRSETPVSAPVATEAVFLPLEAPVAARVFAPDGSIVNIDSQIKALDERVGANATFQYQIAGIAEAETAFELPKAIEFETTRFDRNWRPTANVVDELLERAVKASTVAVSIPVPGMPGYRVGCAVVILAASGGCGLSEPSKLVYDIDDPSTLSPAEADACKIIWDKITAAASQDAHRRYRRIYDLGCRLPLATSPAVRSDAQGFPTTEEIRKEMRQW